MRETIAFSWDSYPFYHQVAACLSEHVGHIDAWLRANGHRIALGEVFLGWPDSVPPTPVTMPSCQGVELSLRWRPGDALPPGPTVEVLRNGVEVSICVCGPSALWSRAPEAEDTLAVLLFSLEEGLQGRRPGLHLLERCPISTGLRNREPWIRPGISSTPTMDSACTTGHTRPIRHSRCGDEE